MADNPLTEYKISPEIFEVTTEYVKHLNIKDTARALGVSEDMVSEIINKPEAKRYIDAIFLEQGYLHRHKLASVMDDLIDQKLAEMRETGLGSNKDILDLLQFMHKMRMDYEKSTRESSPGTQVNIQNNLNGGDNYSKLMQKILEGKTL